MSNQHLSNTEDERESDDRTGHLLPLPGSRDSRRASTRRDRTVHSFFHHVPPARDASGAPCDDGNDQAVRDHIDQPCLDPPVLVQDANPSPPPTHRHSQFWPDPRTTEVGKHLVELLRDEPGS